MQPNTVLEEKNSSLALTVTTASIFCEYLTLFLVLNITDFGWNFELDGLGLLKLGIHLALLKLSY